MIKSARVLIKLNTITSYSGLLTSHITSQTVTSTKRDLWHSRILFYLHRVISHIWEKCCL